MTTASPPNAGATLRRVFALDLETRDSGDSERVVEASLSSEEPVERAWGVELLTHSSDAIDLSHARNGLPLLWQHDARVVLGRVERIRLRGGKLRGRLRFGNSQRAREAWDDVRDNILRDVSIGYELVEIEQGRDAKDRPKYTAVRWRPLEISLVSIPADPSVGIGRSGGRTMLEQTPEARPALDVQVRESQAARDERERVLEIQAIGDRFGAAAEAQRAVAEGWPLHDFRAWVMKHKIPEPRALEVPPSSLGAGAPRSAIGIGGRELEGYSVLRAGQAFATRDFREAGLELEASDQVAKQIGRRARGFFVPWEVLDAPLTRAVEKGGTATGASLVATEHLAGSFVELLRQRAMVRALGATVLSGLVGDVEIPRQAAAASGSWLAEGGTVTPTDSSYDAVTLSPKTVAARTNVTRKMLLQGSPAMEGLVRSDIATVIALALDAAATFGTGSSNQPRGIVNTLGVGSVSFGATVGGAPTWPLIVQLESEVANDNADQGSLGYLTNSRVRGKCKTVEKATNTGLFLWEQPPGTPDGFGMLNGYRAAVSNAIPSNLVEGGSGAVLSAILFGDWSSLLIGEWGTLDVTADPYTLGDSGGLVLRGFWDVDVAVRHPESFAVATDVSTA